MDDSEFIESQLYVGYIGPGAISVSTAADQDCGANSEGLGFYPSYRFKHWKSPGKNEYYVNDLQVSCSPGASEAEPKHFKIFLNLFHPRLLAKPSQACNFSLSRWRVGSYQFILGNSI